MSTLILNEVSFKFKHSPSSMELDYSSFITFGFDLSSSPRIFLG